MTEPRVLLEELSTLRRRARADRHGYAFPLFLFGGLILLAPLLYTPKEAGAFGNPYFPRADESNPLTQAFRANAGQEPLHPNLIAWYWLLTLTLGLLATAWWYRRRGARIGVETDTRGFLIAAGAGFAGFIVGAYAMREFTEALFGAWTVNVPILLGAIVLCAGIVLLCRRPAVPAPLRIAGLFLAAVFAAAGFFALGVYTNRGFTALLVIAVGVLALAWLERSALLGVIGVLFTLASIAATSMIDPYIDPRLWFHLVGWDVASRELEVLQLLLLPAAILLIGGTIAGLTRREVTR